MLFIFSHLVYPRLQRLVNEALCCCYPLQSSWSDSGSQEAPATSTYNGPYFNYCGSPCLFMALVHRNTLKKYFTFFITRRTLIDDWIQKHTVRCGTGDHHLQPIPASIHLLFIYLPAIIMPSTPRGAVTGVSDSPTVHYLLALGGSMFFHQMWAVMQLNCIKKSRLNFVIVPVFSSLKLLIMTWLMSLCSFVNPEKHFYKENTLKCSHTQCEWMCVPATLTSYRYTKDWSLYGNSHVLWWVSHKRPNNTLTLANSSSSSV